jgi:zinc protease
MQTLEQAQIDAASWLRVVDGDTAEFERVVERHQNAVSAIAYGVLGDFAACQDITQETFWQAWRNRHSLRDPARLAAWLCGIARNLAHQSHRTRLRESTLEDFVGAEQVSGEPDPALQSISDEESQLVWRTLETIPENYREALVLYYREDHSIAEVAAALDINHDAAKQRLSRGREMLRENLAETVEGVLKKSKPGRALTLRIMTGVAALSAALKASAPAAAAGLTPSIAKGAASGIAATATKAAISGGAMSGVAGGLAGAGLGLGGAWLGSWLPAQLAPTMTERQFLQKAGKRTLLISVLYTAAILAATPLLFIQGGAIYYAGIVAISSLAFVVTIIVVTTRMQAQIRLIRAATSPESDPNRSLLRMKLEASGLTHMQGRRYTSSARLLGLPLIDVQFADSQSSQMAPGRALGWIAIGDKATGILFAFGGVAKGLVAMGGIAVGGVAIGGFSLGILSLGGFAVGGLAIGGGAIGYDALGGGALAYNSAAGGGAVAYHTAMGGSAIAHDAAIGGSAVAKEVNNDAARALVHAQPSAWLMNWYMANLLVANLAVGIISFLPVLLMPLIYRRRGPRDEKPE